VADAERGRQIFEQRVEYPLPVKAGVKDYVFYCGNLGGGSASKRRSSSTSTGRRMS
jgi:hypothetical protein